MKAPALTVTGEGLILRPLTSGELDTAQAMARRRIWLHIYDFNSRGQHVYESSGYRYFKRGERDGSRAL